MTFSLPHTPTRPPRAHQWNALEKAHNRPAFAYLMEMGTGKSKTLVDEMIQLHMDGTIDRALIVAGAGSYEEWISKHLPENTPDDVYIRAHLWQGGNSKKEQYQLNQLMQGPPALRVIAMNVEAFGAAKHAETVAMNFVSGGRAMFAIDESTKIRNEDASRSIVATRIAKKAVIRRIMTGSPVIKSPMDLWGQLVFLGIENQFASNYYTFRARFCTLADIRIGMEKRQPGATGPAKSKTVKKITGYQNLEKLSRLLDQHSFRVLKEECLDLPPKVYQDCRVPLTQEQLKLYTQMKKIAMAEISEGLWSSTKNAMGRLMKLHQIVLGHITAEDGSIHSIETNRPRLLCDIVEESGDKVIIWCAYRKDVTIVLEELKKRFPDRHGVRYDGEVPRDLRPAARIAFQEGDASWFVGTAATGGHGVTLTASATTLYYSNSFDLEYRIQSEDRNHRDGQTRSVNYVDFISTGTVEEHIVKVLRNKRTMADTVTGDGVREWLKWMED